MLVFGALIFAISYYIFLFRKSITGALVVSGALISIYMIYFHQVVFDVFYSYPDVDKMISYATIVIIIIASKMIVDKYLQNEVGFDLTYLGNKLFPNYHFKLFALYFVGLLFISEKIYLLVITLYFLSNILRIKPAYSYVIITLSLITNLIFRAEALVPAIPDLDYYTSLELTNIVHLFGVFAIFLAFIFITSV
ncbi:MAG: hypothetical protein JJV90_00020, partial [Spiroplasma sp.]|nr:hypothetical protein [Mycoplasmatales bacterium]